MRATKTPSVPALQRGLAILERIANSRRGLTFAQLARLFDFPKSSVHTLVLTLEREGYLQRDDATGRYMTGRKLVHIAGMTLDGLVVRERAAPLLRTLVAETGMTAHLAVLDRHEVTVVAKVDRPGVHRIATWVGKRMDVHCTSLGKCLVAYLPDQQVDRLISRSRPAPPQRAHDCLARAAEAGARADARARLCGGRRGRGARRPLRRRARLGQGRPCGGRGERRRRHRPDQRRHAHHDLDAGDGGRPRDSRRSSATARMATRLCGMGARVSTSPGSERHRSQSRRGVNERLHATPNPRCGYVFRMSSQPLRYSGRRMNGAASGALRARRFW